MELPFISLYKIGMASSWFSFYGKNAALFGLGRVGIGGILTY
ncbi:hypothetical protein [Apibacter adventoris]|nr:hypothetical protein [Apibacter adventoris]